MRRVMAMRAAAAAALFTLAALRAGVPVEAQATLGNARVGDVSLWDAPLWNAPYVYTNTLVSLYTAWFDPAVISDRAARRPGPGG